MSFNRSIIDPIRKHAVSFQDSEQVYQALLDAIGDAQIVLLGESTHGTHEFYTIRAEITKRLIQEKQFHAIALEADWPDAYQINRYIQHEHYTQARDALASFDRFPTWMWRNVPFMQFCEWLHNYNKLTDHKIGLFGLDLYSLYRSIDEIIMYLDTFDPEAAQQARYYYSCFDHFRDDPQAYGYAVFTKAIRSCAPQVLEQLKRLQSHDYGLYIEQNARVVQNAEHYYRSLFIDEVSNWNIRDTHMFETLQALINHYQLKGIKVPKIIVWAHNSHLGNAAATQMSVQGEFNIGQLVKEHFGARSFSLGFTTYTGTVSAASGWHAPVERKQVRPALPESYEALFHAEKIPEFLLLFNQKDLVPKKLLERAIGVVYHPHTERMSHYFYADLARQFDAVIHIDTTHAVEPLEKTSHWIAGEAPETYPSGL